MSDNTITFPTDVRQTGRLVKAFRTGLAEGMAGTGLGNEQIRRALDALEPDIRILGESLVVETVPETVWEYQQAVLVKATSILQERLREILERQ
ncbi:MAG: hypothetical protein K0U72_04925 [Gammaproteobacteria bacterium]|nr:hypothetical protein [Gammaproteobacteria bacterium]